MSWIVKSTRKNGSYFGKFKSADEALDAAVVANEEEKNGASDWEPEEVELRAKAEGDDDFDPEQKAGRYSYALGQKLADAFNALSSAAGKAEAEGQPRAAAICRQAMDTMKQIRSFKKTKDVAQDWMVEEKDAAQDWMAEE
jgi:hypothetical protein